MSRRPGKGRRRYSGDASVGVISITRHGYAFVDTPEGSYFVLPSRLNGAMSGDLVEVFRLRSQEARHRQTSVQSTLAPEASSQKEMLGSVRRVLERAHQTVVGTVEHREGLSIVVTDDVRIPYDVFLDRRYPGKPARDGDLVIVQITAYPSRLQACAGYVQEIIEPSSAQDLGIEMIVRRYGLETNFSPAALAQAHQATANNSMLERRDLRGRLVFTIDPPDAKDFDDALSVEHIRGYLCVGVHIADVSAYVPWESSLDVAARQRSTSVYLPDRVIPMLPPELSEDICSLKPDCDRLCFTVDIYFRPDGSIAQTDFYPSLIRSSARLTYDQVLQTLEDYAQEEPDRALDKSLLTLAGLADTLAMRRYQRGALNFDTPETRVLLDEQNKPVSVYLRKKNRATSLVEECMIAANEAVAAHMLASDAAMIYRIHEEPSPMALEEVAETLREFGAPYENSPENPFQIQALLQANRTQQEYDLLSVLLLRAMKRAQYQATFTGHYGLASSAYTHFTSPIRRYPDLMVHRLLTYQLAKKEPPRQMLEMLGLISQHSTEAEQNAEKVSVDAIKLKLCEFFADKVGGQYQGIISGFTSYGLYLREQSTYAEGFVQSSSLDNGFVYQPQRQRWINPDNGYAFRLGQVINVELIAVDIVRSTLDFVIR